MNHYSGSCLCGEVKFEVRGDLNGFFLCHCSRCRKVTGSAHASNLFSTTAELRWLAGESQRQMFKLENTRFTKSFCKTCGSALPSRNESGRILIPAGSLDSDVGLKPTAHIFVGSRADWDQDLDQVPQFSELPR